MAGRQPDEKLKSTTHDLRLSEKALEESEAKYRTIIETIEDGYFEVDLAGNLIFFNDYMARMTQYTRDQLIGMNNLHYMDKFNAKKVFRTFNKVYTTGVSAKAFDWELIRKDGSKCFVESSVSLKKDSANLPIGFFGIARDITERKLLENALRESEESYRNIIENIEDGYFEVDLAGNFTFFNDCMARMTQYPRNEFIEMNNQEYMDKVNAKKVFRTFNKVYTTGVSAKAFDWELIRKDGSKCFVESSVSLKKDSANLPIGFFGIARDITERKLLENALRQNEKELEDKTRRLEESNIALKVLLQRREEDKSELEERILSNVKELIMPDLDKINQKATDPTQKALLGVLESNINAIISPFSHKLSSKYLNLTSTEIEVANFVKYGKSTKEIAELLGLSSRTIESHRDNIREKIGIKNKKVTLRTHLLSLK